MGRTDKIIKYLKEGRSQRSIIRMGFPESTVRYHYKKLYRPEAYRKIVDRAKEYQKNKREE